MTWSRNFGTSTHVRSRRPGEDMSSVDAGSYREHVPLVDLIEISPSSEAEQLALVAMPKLESSGAKPRRDLSVDQQELVDIMDKLEMRNQDFAVHLGIGVSRLSSYIYGATASVHPDVMARAREVLRERGEGLVGAKRQFSKEMGVIIDEWKQRLMARTNEQLATYLGVTTMTIHRWRTGATRPDLTALARFEQQIEQLESRLKTAGAEIDRQIANGK